MSSSSSRSDATNSRKGGLAWSSNNQATIHYPPVIEPRRFGVKYDPPSIILEYARNGKLRHYEVHLKDHDLEKDPKSIAQRLIKKHGAYFDPSKIDTNQLETLIGTLKDRLSEASSPPRAAVMRSAQAPAVTAFGDLNKVSEEVLQHAKDKMTVVFDQNRVDRTDPSYKWDKREDFVPEEPSDWDDEEDDF